LATHLLVCNVQSPGELDVLNYRDQDTEIAMPTYTACLRIRVACPRITISSGDINKLSRAVAVNEREGEDAMSELIQAVVTIKDPYPVRVPCRHLAHRVPDEDCSRIDVQACQRENHARPILRPSQSGYALCGRDIPGQVFTASWTDTEIVMRSRDDNRGFMSLRLRLHGPNGGVIGGYSTNNESTVTDPLEYRADESGPVYVSVHGAVRESAFEFAIQ
jgi:hypothetical protein